MNLFYLEKKLKIINELSFKELQNIPKKALNLYNDESELGIPTGIGYDDEFGWFVLQTMGQGPQLLWCEKEDNIQHQKRI